MQEQQISTIAAQLLGTKGHGSWGSDRPARYDCAPYHARLHSVYHIITELAAAIFSKLLLTYIAMLIILSCYGAVA